MLIDFLSKNGEPLYLAQGHNVDNRVGTAPIVAESAWAPQTAVRAYISPTYSLLKS